MLLSRAIVLLLLSGECLLAAQPPARDTKTATAARTPARILVVDGISDGRDDLRISGDGLEWVDHETDFPVSVSLNGRIWNVKRQPRLTGNDLRRYFPNGADFTNLELALCKGRGTATLQSHTKDAMVVAIDDPYPGAGAFTVVVRYGVAPWLSTGDPAVPKTSASAAFAGDLRIRAKIDGQDQLRIYRDRAEWLHTAGDGPTDVKINNVDWSPEKGPTLVNAGPTAFLSDFAVLVGAVHYKMHGRSPVTMKVEADHLLLEFSDPEAGTDTYDIVIHQGEVFPDVVVSETNERRVAGLFAESPKTAHPVAANLPTQKDFERLRLEWRRTLFVQAYEKHGRRDPKWDAAALAYLNRVFTSGTDEAPAEDMLAAGNVLIDLGCDDPLICLFHGIQATRLTRYAQAERYLLHAVLEFQKMSYPKRTSRRAGALLASAYRAQAADRSALAYALVQRALRETVEAASGPFTGDERRTMLQQLRVDSRDLLREQWPAFLRILSEAPDADPYLVNMLIADYQWRQGWEGIGNGYAPNVTQENWELFRLMLVQSRNRYVAAWAAYPQYPEAAVRLIRNVFSVGPVKGETSRFWFDQAVAAQIDAEGAHDEMRWALRPAARGSERVMLEFALECLATGRFDTAVPDCFFRTAYDLCYDEYGDLPTLIREAGAEAAVREGIKGFEATGTPQERYERKTRNLVLSSILGWNDDARRRLGELQGNVQEATIIRWGYSLAMLQRDVLYPVPSVLQAPVVDASGTLFEKRGRIGRMAVAGDGRNLAFTTYDDMRKEVITIWDVAGAEPKSIPPNATLPLQTLQFAPDSKSLAIHQADTTAGYGRPTTAGLVTIWKAGEAATRDLNPPGQASVGCFAWLPDGRFVVMGAPNLAFLVDVRTGRIVAQTVPLQNWVATLGVSPTERLLAVGYSDGLVQFFEYPSAAELDRGGPALPMVHVGNEKPHLASIDSLDFSADGKTFVSSSWGDHSAWIWDVKSREPKHRISGWRTTYAPDGRHVATVGGTAPHREVVLWDAAKGQPVRRYMAPAGANLQEAAFAGPEFLIAPSQDGTIHTWKVSGN